MFSNVIIVMNQNVLSVFFFSFQVAYTSYQKFLFLLGNV